MRVFICWLISLCDWIGELSFIYVFIALTPHQATNNSFWDQVLPADPHFALVGGLMAIIPAIVTAVYATKNYDLVLSWAVIRWLSPLNIVTNQFFFFFKTLILSGAAWAALFTYFTFRWFPNANFDWTTRLIKSVFALFM